MFRCMVLHRAIFCLSLSMIDIQGFYAPLALALITHGLFAVCVWLKLFCCLRVAFVSDCMFY